MRYCGALGTCGGAARVRLVFWGTLAPRGCDRLAGWRSPGRARSQMVAFEGEFPSSFVSACRWVMYDTGSRSDTALGSGHRGLANRRSEWEARARPKLTPSPWRSVTGRRRTCCFRDVTHRAVPGTYNQLDTSDARARVGQCLISSELGHGHSDGTGTRKDLAEAPCGAKPLHVFAWLRWLVVTLLAAADLYNKRSLDEDFVILGRRHIW